MVELVKFEFKGSLVRDLPEELHCTLEQDTLCLVLVQPTKMVNHPDMTEKLLTGTSSIKTN